MSIESIISQLDKSRLKKSQAVSEDYFTRIAYIIDKDSNDAFEEFFRSTRNANCKDIMIKYNMLNKLKPVKSDHKNDLKMYPFYLPSIKNINIVKNVADEMKPITWAVPYCNSSSDLAYCILLLRTSNEDFYKNMLAKYTPETVGRYVVLKEVEKKMTSFFKKIDSEK
jgi:hypothetical protein